MESISLPWRYTMNWLQNELVQESIYKEKLAGAERERLAARWKKGQRGVGEKRPFMHLTQFFNTLKQLSRIHIHISFETRDPCAEGTAVQ